MRTAFVCISVLRVGLGSRVKLASCKSALTPPPTPVVYSTIRSNTVVPVLVLLCVALLFILRGDIFYVLPCVICFCVFQSFSHCDYLALGRDKLILVLFACFFDLCLFGCVFSLPLGVRDGLRFVIGTLPGLFSSLRKHAFSNILKISPPKTERL